MLNLFIVLMQLTEKEKVLKEERRKLMEQKKLEEQEKARIKAQVHNSSVRMTLSFSILRF